MNITKKVEKKGFVAMLNGKFWGCQYNDGLSESYDFGGIERAKIVSKGNIKPGDLSYPGCHNYEKLLKSEMFPIVIETTYNVHIVANYGNIKINSGE